MDIENKKDRVEKNEVILRHLKQQSEETIKFVLEKYGEKNSYVYDQMFPNTTEFQDIDDELVKRNMLDNLPKLLDEVEIADIQTPFLSSGIITCNEMDSVSSENENIRHKTLQFIKLVLSRGSEAIKTFLTAFKKSSGDATIFPLLINTHATDEIFQGNGRNQNLTYEVYDEENGILFKGYFYMDLVKEENKNPNDDFKCLENDVKHQETVFHDWSKEPSTSQPEKPNNPGGQHYLICDTEDCERNCQFYCIACDRQLCKQCRHKHKMSPDTSFHDIFPYETYQSQLPEETCNLHPTKNLEILCKECSIPLCSRCCTMPKHQGHTFDYIEDVYKKKISLCQDKLSKIRHQFLPESHDLKKDIKKDSAVIRSVMEEIRISMRSEADSLIHLVHVATLDNVEKCELMEKKLLEMLKSDEHTYNGYIAYLENLDKELRSYMPPRTLEHFFSTHYENLEIKPIPETRKPIHPRFSPRELSTEDVYKLLGRLDLPSTEPERRKIKPKQSYSSENASLQKHKYQ